MWGIGLLILLATYIAIIKLLIRISPSRRFKAIVVIITIALPLIYPFLYHVYPSYHYFLSLCEADDRELIYKTKTVDYLYLGRASSCKNGFDTLNKYNYKGIECEYAPVEEGKEGYQEKGVFRYMRGEKWSSSSCGSSCLKKPYRKLIEECKLSCMDKVKIKKFSNPYDTDHEIKEIIRNRLSLYEINIIDNDEILATIKNYTYYPYGNTWAKILGASSGSAPKLFCKNKKHINKYNVYKPNTL